MKRLFFLMAIVAIPLLSCAQKKATTATKDYSKVIASLDAQMKQAIQDFNVPGMAVAIIKDDQVLLSKGYGVRSVETQQPVTDQSLFAIASNSKAYTSAALACLVDEGKIKWDDKVRTYLPWFELYSPYVSDEMTIRDLLCHRSGLATFSGDLIWYGTIWNREEVVRRARFLQPVFGFREAYGYQNIMFLAAGLVVEKVTGASWDDFIKTRFFSPLGMNRSSTSIRDFKAGDDIAMPHNEVNGKNVQIDYVNWDNIGPAGSINSCVADLTKWMKLQLNKGKFDGKTIWSEDRAYEMWEVNTPKRVSAWQRQNMPSRHFNGYGLGWEIMEYEGYKVVSHGGGYDGMISITVLVPELKFGFVILTNNINSLPSALEFEILDEFTNAKEKKDWLGIFLGFKNEPEEVHTTPAPSEPVLALRAYCGTYSSEMYGDVQVRMNPAGDGLTIDFEPTALFKGNLKHWQYNTFELSWTTQMMLPKGKVNFILDQEGTVTEMRIDVPNPDFDFSELKLFKR